MKLILQNENHCQVLTVPDGEIDLTRNCDIWDVSLRTEFAGIPVDVCVIGDMTRQECPGIDYAAPVAIEAYDKEQDKRYFECHSPIIADEHTRQLFGIAHFAERIETWRPAHRSVDGAKVTDHHALIITGNYVRETLTANERRVYDLICGRMLEAFGPRCEKETLLIEATIGDLPFRSRSVETIVPGWRGVYNRPEEPDGEVDNTGAIGIEFTEGETLSVMGRSLAGRKTRPKPLYTEAALLTAMEESGLGTPATRAGTIETLLQREYIERSGRSLIPTRQGLALYEAVRHLRIADVELTGSWERSLVAIERGEMSPETFMKAIAIFTRQITGEVLSLDLKQPPVDPIPCPKCRQGNMVIRHKIAKCDNAQCGLVVYRRFLNKELTEKHMQQLLRSGKTRLIKGFEGKAGKTFDARLAFDKHFNLTFKFPEKKNGPGGKTKPKPKGESEKDSPVIPIQGQR